MLACKVFSRTKYRDREVLGEEVTDWLRQYDIKPESCEVRQSSDETFHCLSIVIWYQK